MKKIVTLFFALSVFFLMSQESLLGQVKDPVKKTEKAGEKRINKNIDKEINKGFNKLEKGIGGLFKKNKKQKEPPQSETKQSEQVAGQTKDATDAAQTKPSLVWAKYDFVPGDKIIFEDNLEGEENGEFPSRWDLQYGNVEIAQFGGENVIMFMSGSSCIIPYLKNPEQDYLPDIFTIEFDVYYDIEPHSAKYFVALYDKKNQKGTGQSLQNIKLFPGGIQYSSSDNLVSGSDGLWYNRKNPFWRHISIGFNIRSLKVYYDDVRMLNIPHIEYNPTGLSISIINTTPVNFYMKNIRIAEGGQKLYDKFLQDGKIVSNGIRFNTGKASLRPESMGVLNGIYDLLSKHPEVNFSIEGHTDSDGDFDFNQKLSEKRAKTVLDQLISMGIDAGRLTSKGFGESKPVNTNNTPEGKAANRRVEFVKS